MRLTGKQLRQYLAYEIHGRKPERKPPQKARTSRGPIRSEPYKAWIRTLPSIVSGLMGCEACHVGSDGGMGIKCSDTATAPLTPAEHREYHQHGKRAFEKRHGVSFAREVKRLNREWRIIQKRRAA